MVVRHRMTVTMMMPRSVDLTVVVAVMMTIMMHAVTRVRMMPAIAVHDRTGHGRAVIVMMHGVGVTAAVVGVVIRAAVGIPSGNGGFLIGRHRREVPRTAEGRPLIDIIILCRRRQTFI